MIDDANDNGIRIMNDGEPVAEHGQRQCRWTGRKISGSGEGLEELVPGCDQHVIIVGWVRLFGFAGK